MTLRQLAHPIVRRLETNVHPLRYLFLEITQRCNLSCLHCGSDCSRDASREELSTEEWLEFFGYLGDNTDTGKVALVITGGEPFCHPEFDRILQGLRDHRLAWGMVTNGYALNPTRVQKLLACGMRSVTVSLDGLRSSHDWLRNTPGSFRRALSGIKALVGAGIPLIDVVTCVHPGNLAELPQVLDLLIWLGVPAWRLFSIFPKGRARNHERLLLNRTEFSTMLKFIEQKRTMLRKSGFRLQFSCEGYLPPATDRLVRDEPYFCRAGINIASVLSDGSISACPNVSRQLIQGNIRQDDFLDVWENRFQAFRERDWMRRGKCRDCSHWSRCLGNSMHLWDDEQNRTCRCTYQMVS